jgi:hypothetical protein
VYRVSKERYDAMETGGAQPATKVEVNISVPRGHRKSSDAKVEQLAQLPIAFLLE